MKKVLVSVLWIVSLCGIAAAQNANKAEEFPPNQVIDAWITNTEKHVVPVAEAMPEDKYSFAPRNGEFNGVRTFGEQLKHLAANNYKVSAFMLGEKPTADQANETGPDSIRSKAEIVEYVKGSFAALHKATASVTTANMGTAIRESREIWARERLGLAIDAVANSFIHYGQMIEYLRMNGIVPPDSRPR